MPYRVRKRKDTFLIQKKEGSKWKTVGHSNTRAKAEASVRARYAAEGRKKRR